MSNLKYNKIPKMRIVKHYWREEATGKVRHVFKPQWLAQGVTFWRKRPWEEWVDFTHEERYFDTYTVTEVFKTEEEAREFVRDHQELVPEDEILP